MRSLFILWISLGFLALPLSAQTVYHDIPPAFGTNLNLKPMDFAFTRSYGPKDRIVGTYYFYWYNVETKEHIIDGDGTDALTTHPASLEDFSYDSVTWHKQQLTDMITAGIDVVLPVFWGAPSEQDPKAEFHWSYRGIPKLVQAREELLRAGKKPPFIGMFYDTSTLQYNHWGEHQDLTTPRGQQWFYATIRDFFSMVPTRHWAFMEGRPIVLLYSSSFAANHDQRVIDYTKKQFASEFGGREPWMVAEVSWRVDADGKYAWGGALGLKNPGVASLGPGYDHSAVPGREPLVVPRANGKFYEAQWIKFLRRPSQMVMVETWNELHEGTDIAESREYGRRYIELTKKYANMFRREIKPTWPKGPYTRAKEISVTLGETNEVKGLTQIENEDGQTAAVTVGDRPARALKRDVTRAHYMYFAIDESFKWADLMDAQLDVEYFDAAAGTLGVEFDGSDPAAPFSGAYSTSAQTVTLTGSKTWQTNTFKMANARFLNSQNRGADFRLTLQTQDFAAARITLKRIDGPALAPGNLRRTGAGKSGAPAPAPAPAPQ